jgi:hypothetical protein
MGSGSAFVVFRLVDSFNVLIKHGPQDFLVREAVSSEPETHLRAGGTLSGQEIVVRTGRNHQFRIIHRRNSLPQARQKLLPSRVSSARTKTLLPAFENGAIMKLHTMVRAWQTPPRAKGAATIHLADRTPQGHAPHPLGRSKTQLKIHLPGVSHVRRTS